MKQTRIVKTTMCEHCGQAIEHVTGNIWRSGDKDITCPMRDRGEMHQPAEANA